MDVCPIRSERIKTALKKRYPNGRFASDNPNWKGGRRLGPNGYIEIYSPGHPAARANYVMEHRLVMEKILGRYLHRKEHVHHKNENKTDNDPSNLELISQADHARRHMTKLRTINALEDRIASLEERVAFLESLLEKP